jgi:hypothetical protein
MRKVLLTAAALVLCAAPVHAQQALSASSAAAPTTVQMAEPTSARTASLYPSTDAVRRDVAVAESKRVAPLGSRDWWYLVAAVAVGVIIAAILL